MFPIKDDILTNKPIPGGERGTGRRGNIQWDAGGKTSKTEILDSVWRHLSGFGGWGGKEVGVSLASSGQRPKMLLNISLCAQDSSIKE